MQPILFGMNTDVSNIYNFNVSMRLLVAYCKNKYECILTVLIITQHQSIKHCVINVTVNCDVEVHYHLFPFFFSHSLFVR